MEEKFSFVKMAHKVVVYRFTGSRFLKSTERIKAKNSSTVESVFKVHINN